MKFLSILPLFALLIACSPQTRQNQLQDLEKVYYSDFDIFKLEGKGKLKTANESTSFPFVEVIHSGTELVEINANLTENHVIEFVLEKKNGIIFSKQTRGFRGMHEVDTYTIFTSDTIYKLNYFPSEKRRSKKRELSGIGYQTLSSKSYARLKDLSLVPVPSDDSFKMSMIPWESEKVFEIKTQVKTSDSNGIASEQITESYLYSYESGKGQIDTMIKREEKCYDFTEEGSYFWWSLAPTRYELEVCP